MLVEGFYEWLKIRVDETDLEDDTNKNVLARLPYFVYNAHQQAEGGDGDTTTSAGEVVPIKATEGGVDSEPPHPKRLLAMAGLYDCWRGESEFLSLLLPSFHKNLQ